MSFCSMSFGLCLTFFEHIITKGCFKNAATDNQEKTVWKGQAIRSLKQFKRYEIS